MVDAGATVLFRHRGPEQSQLAEFGHNLAVKHLVAKPVLHPGHELVLAVVPRGVPHHPLIFSELIVKQEGVFPGKSRLAGLCWRLGR